MNATPQHPHVAMLRSLYADFSLLGMHATDGIVLHRADRATGDSPVSGKKLVLAHEKALVDATEGTLFMDVEHIAANDFFGAVLGMLRTTAPAKIAMPFCGLWRFENGKVAEHWENAYDVTVLGAMFNSPDAARRPS